MSEQVIAKQCTKCKEIKEIIEFRKNRRNRDGRHCWCKKCQQDNRRKYRQTQKGKHHRREERLRYYRSKNGQKYYKSPKYRASKNRRNKKYRVKYPLKIKAANAVNNAIRNGRLPEPESKQCHCGNQASHYHHNLGYAPKHWFDVIPVCVSCHRKIHHSIAISA